MPHQGRTSDLLAGHRVILGEVSCKGPHDSSKIGGANTHTSPSETGGVWTCRAIAPSA